MKRLAMVCLVVFAGVAGWHAVEQMSSDAVGMAVGVLFGVLAGIPAALLVVASQRRAEQSAPPREPFPLQQMSGGYGHQPPVIVFTGQAAGDPARRLESTGFAGGAWPTRPQRHFQVVGDGQTGLEEWS